MTLTLLPTLAGYLLAIALIVTHHKYPEPTNFLCLYRSTPLWPWPAATD